MSQRYQPEWKDGREVGTGRRDAAGRYKLIADYLDGMREFHVLDFGAYGNYFSARLASDFGAHCVAVDDCAGLTEAPGVTVVNRRLSMPELVDLGTFDVALCLSVLHHLPDWRAYLDALTSMAPLVFVETAWHLEILPKARAHRDSIAIHDAVLDAGGKILGYTPGYDASFQRPLWVIDRRPEPTEPPKPVKRPRRPRAAKPA